MKRIACTCALVALLLPVVAGRVARAEEGMYPLAGTSFLPVEEMKEAGLKVSPDELLRLRRAVAKVASGGSGSFVSPEGLLVTNHHVAYRCLAALDGLEAHKGIMDEGHVASTRDAVCMRAEWLTSL